MKFACLLALALTPFILFAQTAHPHATIRKAVERINSDKNYDIRVLNNQEWMTEIPDGGGKLTGYLKNGRLVKVVEWVGLSRCVLIREYYFADTKVIFVYGQEKAFTSVDSTGVVDFASQNTVLEYRVYFEEEKLLDLKFTGESICSELPTETTALQLIVNGKRYTELLEKF